MEKQTPKQRVLAVYPNAVADSGDDGSWRIWSDKNAGTDKGRELGRNGSANGAWKNAAEQLPSSGRSEYDDPIVGLDVTHPGGPPTVVFGPNDYVENGGSLTVVDDGANLTIVEEPVYPEEHGPSRIIGVDPALPGSEKTLLTRLDARDPAFLRAVGRVNGMSKLRSDSRTGKRLKPGVTRQQERNENTHRTRFRGLNTPQAHNLPNANPFYPLRKRNVFSPGVMKALGPFGRPKSNYKDQMRELVLERGFSVGMK